MHKVSILSVCGSMYDRVLLLHHKNANSYQPNSVELKQELVRTNRGQAGNFTSFFYQPISNTLILRLCSRTYCDVRFDNGAHRTRLNFLLRVDITPLVRQGSKSYCRRGVSRVQVYHRDPV